MNEENNLLDGYQDGVSGMEPVGFDPQRAGTTQQPQDQSPTAAQPGVEVAGQPQQQQSFSGQPDNPIGGLMEQLAVGARDFVDNVFQGDQLTKDQIRENRQGMRDEQQAQDQQRADEWEKRDDFIAESQKAIAGGVTGAVENLGEGVEFLGDAALTVTGFASDTDNIFSQNYETAEWDLGVAENQTAVGNFAREGLALLINLRQLGKVPGIGKLGTKKGIAGRLAGETFRGAVVDFLVNPGESNLSNELEKISPALKDTFLTALAHDEDDSPFTRRIRNTIEGGIFGFAVDGISELIGALRAGKKALKAGKSTDEAVEAVVKKLDEGEAALPGREMREAEVNANGAGPDKPSTWEPNERATKTSGYSAEDGFKSQAEMEGLEGTVKVSSNPVLTDAAYTKILSSQDVQLRTAEAVAQLDTIVRETASTIDVDRLSKDLGQSWEKTTGDALKFVQDFLTNNTADATAARNFVTDLSDLKKGVQEGEATLPFYMTRQGVVALKTLIKDTAVQIDELAEAASDVARIGGDTLTQNRMLFDRMRGLLRMHKTSSIHYGSGLQAFKIGSLDVGNSKSGLTSALEQIDDALIKLRKGVEAGDPQAMAEVKNMAKGLAMSGGDATKQLSFMQLARQVGWRTALSSMYNSMLSGPLTQTRNVIGTASAAVLRPVSMAIGYGLQGDAQMARTALSSFYAFGDSVSEAFAVMGKSFTDNAPVNAGQKFATRGDETKLALAQLKQSVDPNNHTQQNAVWMLERMHWLLADNALVTLPTRTMTAVDDAFKTLVGRMELKRQVFEQSIKDGGGFTFDEKAYAELAQNKFGINGEIIDSHILDIAKDATFQRELRGFPLKFQEMTESNPVAKLFFPFVKTPMNIIEYGASYVPGVKNFLTDYKLAKEAGDEAALAMYRGREALGFATMTTGLALGLSGSITGAGNSDPDLAKLDSRPKYSIKISGKWVSYQNIEGLAPILGAFADLALVAHKMSFKDYQASAAQLMYSISAATLDRSYFQGMAAAVNLLEGIRRGQGAGIVNTSAEVLNNLVPFAGARRQFGKAIAPNLQAYNNRLNQILGASLLPADGATKIDIFTGKSVANQNYAGGFHGFLNNILPFNITDVDTDPLKKKLSEVGFDVKLEFGETMKSLQLTPQQVQTLNKYIAEAGLKREMNRVINSKWWQEDYNNWVKARQMGNALPKDEARWFLALQRAYDSVEQVAKGKFAAEDPEFAQRVAEDRRRQAAGRNGVYKNLMKPMGDNTLSPNANAAMEIIQFGGGGNDVMWSLAGAKSASEAAFGGSASKVVPSAPRRNLPPIQGNFSDFGNT